MHLVFTERTLKWFAKQMRPSSFTEKRNDKNTKVVPVRKVFKIPIGGKTHML